MKSILFILISIVSCSVLAGAQSYINVMGNCESKDNRLHYENFAFFASNTDTTEYTHVFSFYCGTGVGDMADDNLQKQFFTPFHFISYNSEKYMLSKMTVNLIYSKRDSVGAKNEFLIELKTEGIIPPVAYVYGSDNTTSNPAGFRVTLGYLVSMDNIDTYASAYTVQELSYTLIYNQNGSYLYEIHDNDRNNLLVGFKYFSPVTSTEHIKFILPNN